MNSVAALHLQSPRLEGLNFRSCATLLIVIMVARWPASSRKANPWCPQAYLTSHYASLPLLGRVAIRSATTVFRPPRRPCTCYCKKKKKCCACPSYFALRAVRFLCRNRPRQCSTSSSLDEIRRPRSAGRKAINPSQVCSGS